MKSNSQRRSFACSFTFTLMIAVMLVTSAQAQPFVFSHADYITGKGPRTLAVGDFNGDGKMDIVVGDTNDPSNIVSVLLANADGTFAAAKSYTVNGPPAGVAVGDFNHDGKLDIAVASGFQSSAGVSILLGNGDGTFRPFTFFPAGQGPTSIAVGDFNGDGKLDIALSDNEGAGSVDILLGKGDGTFATWTSYATAGDPRMVVVADFNKDGKLDLATANSATGTVSVLLGKGDGTFPTHTEFTTENGTISLTVGDLRHDGNQDIIAGCQPNGDVDVLLSNGDGTFKAAAKYPVPAGVEHVAVGDFNGDGKIDVAVTNGATAGMVSILLGRGNGTLNKTPVIFGTAFGPEGVAVADFNDDGVADLAVTNNESSPDGIGGSVSVLLSNGKSLFAGRTDFKLTTSANSGAYNGLAVGDLNGDGKPDLVVPVTFANQLSVLINSGGGKFKPFKTYDLPNSALSVVTGDFNNDHKVDVAAVKFGGDDQIMVLLNTGGGNLGSPMEYSFDTSGEGQAIAAGDFNKDGNLDLVVTNLYNGTVNVLLGDGTGAFPTFATYKTGPFPYSVVVADFNNDGWPDLAVANQSDGTVSVLLNTANGSGTFSAQKSYSVGGNPSSITAGSFRGNGIVDLAVATTSFSPGVVVLLGKGDGTFPSPAVAYNTLNNAYVVTAGDFNHDGKLDLAVGINGGGSFGFVTLMLGNGDGTFGLPLDLTTGTTPTGIVAADFNKDGSLDLATSNGSQAGDLGSASVLLNLPAIGLTARSLSFGNQKVGTNSNPQTITVGNPAAAPLHLTSITTTGDFTRTDNCPPVLASGAQCTISVTFSPTMTGLRTGTLTIKDSAKTSPNKLGLTGTGT